MSSTKKRRDLNRAIEEHKTVRLSAQLATSNHTMLNIVESILAKANEALRAQIAAQAAQIEVLHGALMEASGDPYFYELCAESQYAIEQALFAKDFSPNIQEHANMTAILRESGEWIPELGD